MSSCSLSKQDQQTLLDLARASIQQGIKTGRGLAISNSDFPEPLLLQRATFVTLESDGALRGCIGTLEARQSLAADIAENAFAAAFRDPRFPVLTQSEFDRVDIHISILTPPEPMNFESEEDLLSQIRPGIDGLILSEGGCRGTFLPSVWESLPEAKDFLRHLKVKAGLPPRHWSPTVTIERYECEMIPPSED